MTPWWLAWDALAVTGGSVWAWWVWRRESRRRALEQAQARHLRLAGGAHQCCRLVGVEQCGLWCCHAGECVARVGDYLPPPLVHPLDMLLLDLQWLRRDWRWMRCPICRAGPNDWHGFSWGIDYIGLVVRCYYGGENSAIEAAWRFTPCGCEGRQIVEEQQ